MDAVDTPKAAHRSSLDDLGPLHVTEVTGAGEARRMAQRMASALSMSEDEQGRVGIVATELATNQVKHAPGGLMLFEPLVGERPGMRIIATDRGRGMDVSSAVRDGFSSAGTAGNGLGAIQRLSDDVEFHSVAGRGTAIVARIGGDDPIGASGFSMPIAGEEVCGDAWAVSVAGGFRTVIVADGLGHGAMAAEAARVAVEGFLSHPAAPIETILRVLHGLLRPTRGAAVAIARVQDDQKTLRYGGVGNISATVFSSAGHRSLISHNGSLGVEARKFQEFVYDWPEDATLVMHSDGLTTQWKLADVPGLVTRQPALVASVLVREFSRGRDDATAFVLKARARR